MSQFEIREVPRQDTAVIHAQCPPDAIQPTMQSIFGRLFGAVGRAGGIPSGTVFTRYLAWSDEGIEFETGVALSRPIVGDVEVEPGELGGCTAAVGMHIGPYESIHETYTAMQDWISHQGHTPAGTMWEVYLSDPRSEPDPAAWRTEIFWPVE